MVWARLEMSLAAIETELLQRARAERRRWQDIAQLLMRVENERLWENHASSFTAWLAGMARRADLQESVFWRCLKAGRIYRELTGREDFEQDLAVSAESLELADKIRRHAPRAVTTQVVERALEGDLSRSELREVWATYRPLAGGNTARGRLPDDEGARDEAVAARLSTWEAEKRKPENRAEARRGELISAFREASWLGAHDQARCEPRLQGVDGRLSALLVVRRKPQFPERLELHGLWTCVSEPELRDYEYKAPAGVDFMWLALGQPELQGRALASTPHMLGLLELTRDRALCVLRPAQPRPGNASARVDLLARLLQRAYLWPW
jgi:hypothetical protein